MLIRPATTSDVMGIHQLAHQVWRATYRDILPLPQIELMLNNMYSQESLEAQIGEGTSFIIAENEGRTVAFASYSLSEPQFRKYKIHKLYVSMEQQGKGIGVQLLSYIKKDTADRGGKSLELNVNRNNPAVEFYKKAGFNISVEMDIPYFGYSLNDYVMEMPP